MTGKSSETTGKKHNGESDSVVNLIKIIAKMVVKKLQRLFQRSTTL